YPGVGGIRSMCLDSGRWSCLPGRAFPKPRGCQALTRRRSGATLLGTIRHSASGCARGCRSRQLTSRTHRRTQWSRGLYDDSHVADGGSLSVSVKGDRLPVGADEPQRSRGGSIEVSQGQRQKGGTMRGNFFETLFDFKFEKFLIVRVAQVLYTLVVDGTGLYAGLFARAGLQADQPARLIYAVVGWFLMILVARINLELMLVMFRIFEHTEDSLLYMQ